MSSTSPPIEAQRFGRSQTPESPRPVHTELANIPVLLNQMDPIFNDTATYNIPNQTFSPYPEHSADQGMPNASGDEHDPVQSFFREAENQAAAEPIVTQVSSDAFPSTTVLHPADPFPSVSAQEENLDYQLEESLKPADPEIENHEPLRDVESEPALAPIIQPGLQSQVFDHSEKTEELLETGNQDGEKVPTHAEEPSSINDGDRGVDYQSLLDTIAQSASTAPTADGLTIPTTSVTNIKESTHSLPSIPGLPAKPPPQEHPVEFPSFSYSDTARRLEAQQLTNLLEVSTHAQEQSHSKYALSDTNLSKVQSLDPAYNQSASSSNGLAQLPSNLLPGQASSHPSMAPIDLQRSMDPSERPWTPKTQSIYDRFLEDERRYVTEGIWDKFPNGSRLFVGNLPSEKVTKRDLFHTFHKYGQLAQISIKQAYGFVQFLEAPSCAAALQAEQGVEIRGRKVHLEISKPQKNTRNTGGGGGGGGNKGQARRRSRSPDRARGRNSVDYRDEPNRRRDDYRSRRSPSPRGYRTRSDIGAGPRDGRSRSPSYGNNHGTSQSMVFDDEAALPLPRRDPRGVPDVQVLVLEPEVVQSFINWVEQAFRSKGLQASTIWLNPRLPLAAVVKRQIIEGVQAVVKLTRAAQNSSKIPLQVFDRTGGASNVSYNEYVDLDIQIAADIVLQARAKERGQSLPLQSFRPPLPPYPPIQAPYQGYSQPPPPSLYGQPPPPPPHGQFPPPTPPYYPQPTSMHQQQTPYPPQQSGYRQISQPPPPTPHTPQPNLQQLLANLRQPSTQGNAQGLPSTQNGQSFSLNGAPNAAAPQQHQYSQSSTPQPQFGQYSTNAPSQAYGVPSQLQGHQQQNVQSVMEQLARYQR